VPFDEFGAPQGSCRDVMRRKRAVGQRHRQRAARGPDVDAPCSQACLCLTAAESSGWSRRRDVICAIAGDITIDLVSAAMEPTGTRYQVRGSHSLVDPDCGSRATVDGWATNVAPCRE